MKNQMSGISELTMAALLTLASYTLLLISSNLMSYNWFRWIIFAILFAVFLVVLIWLLTLGIQNWKESGGKASVGFACLGLVLVYLWVSAKYDRYEAVASIEQTFLEQRGMTRKEYGRNRMQDIYKKYEDCFKKCEPCIKECNEEYQRKVEATRHISKDNHDPHWDCGYRRELAITHKAACRVSCTAGCREVHEEQIMELNWWLHDTGSRYPK
jgi:hypothetical protein